MANVADDKIVSLFRKRKLLVVLLSLLLLLATTVGIVTLYGLHTGGFTMSIADDLSNAGVKLYERIDDKGVSQLKGPELSKVQPMMQPQVLENYVYNNGGGMYESTAGDYIGYTFFVKNEGTTEADMQSKLTISGVTHHMDDAIRIWVFTSRGIVGENNEIEFSTLDKDGVIYQKADSVEKTYEGIKTAYGNYRATTNFETNTSVVTTPYVDVNPGEILRISIIMWVEGEDPDCGNNLIADAETGEEIDESQEKSSGNVEGGSIKIAMAFTSYKEKIV